ncbi:sensor histidine kinase [Rhizobium helianthi]|uniref:histidine kinase n=1 Tax=Rhizobium helianthi TaxID=1132695 RepID=A0ABW4M820_9HYPH
MNKISGKAVQVMDRLSLRWLQMVSDRNDVRGTHVVALRLLCAVCLACLFLLPVLFVSVLSPALALPVSAALMLATLVCVTAAAILLTRENKSELAHEVVGGEAEGCVLDAVPGLALVCDPQGRVLRAGGRDRYLLPSSRLDPRGLTLAELVHVSDRIAVQQALDVLRQGGSSAQVEARIEHGLDQAGGRQFLATVLDISPVCDENGDLAQVFVQLREQTETVLLREEVARRTAEALSANETKSRFLAAVSHELRTPLNAILGFSDVLAGEYFGRLENDRQREYVGLIRQSGAHLLAVVNAMLDMSRIEAGRYELLTEPFPLGDAVEACRAMLDLQARNKGVTLTTRLGRNLGELVADPRAVQQILINLAGNAIKFTDGGGVVTIDAVREGPRMKLIVSDTGIGIATEKMALIGQPFCQVQDDYSRGFEGSGLGLSLVKGLVALHGGQFAIESRLGEGTVVTVTLPVDGPAGEIAVSETGETVEFPPRLAAKADAVVTSRQGLAHDRAQAKSA